MIASLQDGQFPQLRSNSFRAVFFHHIATEMAGDFSSMHESETRSAQCIMESKINSKPIVKINETATKS